MSDIEGKAARVAASEYGQRVSFNGANGMRDIEGKVAREAMSECGQRASFKAVATPCAASAHARFADNRLPLSRVARSGHG